MARLEATARDETVFVVSPQAAPEALLERVADARRVGATVLAIDAGDDELAALAHDRIAVPTMSQHRLELPDMSFADMTSTIDFDTVSHLVSVAAGENFTSTTMRQRMARLIERMSGPSPRP
jgi:DNA-binding MurR/RpiR family transcriptional regulator